MAKSANIANKLRKIASSLEELATALEVRPSTNGKSAHPVRKRRTKKEAAALKKLLKAERKAGVPVAELAKKHGITSAYIYMLQ
jgi:hypothetical protein